VSRRAAFKSAAFESQYGLSELQAGVEKAAACRAVTSVILTTCLKGSLMKLIQIGLLVILLSSCAAPIKNAGDIKSSLRVVTGYDGCVGCTGIKTFSTPDLDSSLYALKTPRGGNTGERISASIALGATNKNGRQNPSSPIGLYDTEYAKTLVGPGHLFDKEVVTDPKHPYQFFVRIHHNSSSVNQRVYLLSESNEPTLVPSFKFEGSNYPSNCFPNTGCSWDEDYAISAQVVKNAIEKNIPLKVFVGMINARLEQVQSKDGLNKSYVKINEGVFLSVAPDYLKSFIEAVKAKLGS
jgi:hypothetical protein